MLYIQSSTFLYFLRSMSLLKTERYKVPVLNEYKDNQTYQGIIFQSIKARVGGGYTINGCLWYEHLTSKFITLSIMYREPLSAVQDYSVQGRKFL